MKQSKLLLNTLRESPGEAEAASHQLLIRAGFIRQLASGIYTYLPLGRRVLRKIEQIVREEMDAADAQELLMPAMQPAELWKESGRYSLYGPELIRLQDRHDREFALGPTHEEVITTLVRSEINTYRKLPVILYQIQTKFRDERRPRFGLLRGREFLMKDAYSFDMDWEGLDRAYWSMFHAYERIFQRCGLNFRAVEADAGAIGGVGETHEFMALADIGEDTVVTCSFCDYAANLEQAESDRVTFGSNKSLSSDELKQETGLEAEKFYTPNIRTIEELIENLHIDPAEILKTVVFLADDRAVAVVVSGSDEINEVKVKNYLKAASLSIADPDAVMKLTGVTTGFIGPKDLSVPVLVDQSVVHMTKAIAGANEKDYHFRNVNVRRDIPLNYVGDFRNVKEGEHCPRCKEGTFKFYRGIEVGHVFKLGTKYSEHLGAAFLDAQGESKQMIMGCYGIGVSRLLSAVIEQHHDEDGMIWPISIAPMQVHIIPVSAKDEVQMGTAWQVYDRLMEHGAEVLLDDRDERPGVKFKDADLIGLPIRIVVGKGAADGLVEFMERSQREKELITLEEAVERVKGLL
ncbi:proline--tRNA ligase [Paenibacillus woosongensis]|uniref:Proline--tRNA ligase n=1 Tax=Paenibacillus woosongensis TaxID=307580 RepID=A0AA95I4E6_9BACL|nr:proline--tRNA ligase [Paenibacillus woosongensis]WHX46948.1 proline--tRNA ligase [Paenibacillus woosongensis]